MYRSLTTLEAVHPSSAVRRFLNQSGGRIEVASAPGRGTTVRVYLPAQDQDEALTETVWLEALDR